MNKVCMTGRLTKDPELRSTPTGTDVAAFGLAVQRSYKNTEGNYEADFINVVAWRSSAKFVQKYFKKGDGIEITGRLQSRTYTTNDGSKRYVVEVVAETIGFGAKKKNDSEHSDRPDSTDDLFGEELSDFEPVSDVELPW